MRLTTPCCDKLVKPVDLDTTSTLTLSRICPKCRAWYTVQADRDAAGNDWAKWTRKGTAPRGDKR